MFIGHYGPALAAKAFAKTVPLWVLFVAAQWVDFLWATFVILGVEKVRLIANFFGMSPLDLFYMPYTHGLPSAVLLSLFIGGVAAAALPGNRTAILVAVAATAFSHWLLDLVVHRPDLPLIFDEMKVGFGLWAYPYVSVPVEIALMFGGLWLYDRAAPSPTRAGTIALWALGVFMAALQVQNTFFNEHPATPEGFAQLSLFGYVLLTLFAAGVDYARKEKAPRRRAEAL
ncbi:MAG: hypothetical protein JNK07_11370 [Alphaproteobacteria bacterium]|nr:hypothetical protein [Alphaproteobacteria bacterium]